jgi:8-amino-7-oxononanoate synthase
MNAFDTEMARRLAEIQLAGLRRELRRIDSPQTTRVCLGGRELLNFSSNDYLGLANHPLLLAAAHEAVERYGAGSGASRLVCGSLAPHHELEEALASFKGTPASLVFSTGYAAAVGTITALAGRGDILIIDKLSHACIVDGARLSGATLRVFAHNDVDDLEKILKWAEPRRGDGHLLVITESVFSMDGDHAPLREIVQLKDKYGAWLMVDEAHGTGVLGPNRRGLAELLGVSDQIEMQMGTLGKALGSSGGYVCGSRELIDLLVNRARSFIFSTAPVPAAAASARAGVELVQSAEGAQLNRRLWENIESLRVLSPGLSQAPAGAIMPLIIGSELEATRVAANLREAGLLVPAIRFPTVARGAARLRVTVTAAHHNSDLKALAEALRRCGLEKVAGPAGS